MVKQITAYFVCLNLDIFSRKSRITEFRQNAAFEAQNLTRISAPRIENTRLDNIRPSANKLITKAISIICFVSHRPPSREGGSVGR